MEGLTLRQRIAAITGEIKIAATGKTERGQRTISIGDVDAALGPLMAKHGVISHYRFLSEPTVAYELPTRNEGTLRMWKVHIEGVISSVVHDGDHPEHISSELWDIGSSPSGAVSFALKRWLRALFKLAEDDDARDLADQERARAAAPAPPRQTQAKPPMTLAQQIAMVCRNARIDRSHLIKALTGQEHGRDLTREQAEEVLRTARAIERGEVRLVDLGDMWAIQAIPEQAAS